MTKIDATAPDRSRTAASRGPDLADMIRLPGGTFYMGSDKHYPEEAPAHRVTIEQDDIRRHSTGDAHQKTRRVCGLIARGILAADDFITRMFRLKLPHRLLDRRRFRPGISEINDLCDTGPITIDRALRIQKEKRSQDGCSCKQ